MNQHNKSKESSHATKNQSVQVEARSIELALVKASGLLGITQDEIDYQIVREEAPKGIFSFFKTPSVTITAKVKTPQKGTLSSNSENKVSKKNAAPTLNPSQHYEEDDEDFSSQRDPLPPEKIAALTEELKDFCGGIIQRISGEDPKISTQIDEGRLIITSDNEYLGQQISKNTKLAEAMEHILRKKPRHLKQELPFRIFVDVGGMRRKREEELVQMALDLSVKVHENKRPIVLNYKSSYDRKIIHMALDKDDRVYTKSIGSGPNRKLMILPNKFNQGDIDNAHTQTPQVINVD